jgi:hypothetical protein
LLGGSVYDLADDLVADDEGVTKRRQISLEDVEVGAADSAGEDLEEDVARRGCGARHVFDGECGCVGAEEGGFHRRTRCLRW